VRICLVRLDGAKFSRQHPVGSYIADFFCLEGQLVIELDGRQHGEDAERHVDERRTEYLESQGYRVLRFGTTRF
jgi:very-short-patch-repair endonuclease